MQLEHKYKNKRDNIIWTESLSKKQMENIKYNYLGVAFYEELSKSLIDEKQY